MKYTDIILLLSILILLSTANAQESSVAPTAPAEREAQLLPAENGSQREIAAEKLANLLKKFLILKRKEKRKKLTGPTAAELANTPKSLEILALSDSLTKSADLTGDETPLTSGLFTPSEMRDPGDSSQNETG